jgi:CrcB protein
VSRPSELILAVAVGSAAGGVARYLLTEAIQVRTGGTFPLGTLLVNIVGCFALGFIAQTVLHESEASPRFRALLATGVCGGFTTFSAFSLETVRMLEEGDVLRASSYIGASVVLGLTALWLGMVAGRLVRPT